MKIKFHNLMLEGKLNPSHKFLAADECGAVYSYKDEPFLRDWPFSWIAQGNGPEDLLGGEYSFIDDVDMTELNVGWTDSLTEVNNEIN